MKTRMEKYYDEENNNIALRQQKNEKLYENINDYEVEDYKLETNATVLDNNAKNICPASASLSDACGLTYTYRSATPNALFGDIPSMQYCRNPESLI